MSSEQGVVDLLQRNVVLDDCDARRVPSVAGVRRLEAEHQLLQQLIVVAILLLSPPVPLKHVLLVHDYFNRALSGLEFLGKTVQLIAEPCNQEVFMTNRRESWQERESTAPLM